MSRRISVSQIEKLARWERGGAYATARPWTSAAATCSAASAATGRKQWCSRRTASVVSTGVAWFSARNAWSEKSSVSVSDELRLRAVSIIILLLLEDFALVWGV